MQRQRRPSTLPRRGRPLRGFINRIRKARMASGSVKCEAELDSSVSAASMDRLMVAMTRSSWVLNTAL